jgi:Protein of unknown function (DUF4232)
VASTNPTQMRRRRVLCLLAVLCAIGVSACGSTTVATRTNASAATHSGTTGTTAQTSSTATPSTTTATGTSSTPSTATTTGSGTTTSGGASVNGATPACTATTLKLGYLGGQGATGHGELGFSLTNTGSASCHTYGYPGVEFLSSSGAALPTDSTRTTSDFFGSLPEHELTVAPGAEISFRLGVTHVAQGSDSASGCVTAAELQVIPPDDTHTLVVTIPDGGAYECGTTTVSPVQPGTSAFSG